MNTYPSSTIPDEPEFPGRRALLLFLLFAVAFWLRLGGISHDLQFDTVYHPDTPKQVRAVEQYIHGDYLVLYDHPDYDGYPYFNSYLVAMVVRGVMAIQTVWLQHVGAWTEPVSPPDNVSLFFIMRVWNAFLSALAVPLIFLIGIRFGRTVAWAAAALLLLSPLDLNACHFAANDTASAFFALAALWFAFRIFEQGRFRDLLGGAFCVGASFSSKYHGAMCVLPVWIGLYLYVRNHGGMWTRASMIRWVTLAILGLASVAATSQALLIYPSRAFDDILAFFQYTANFGLPKEFRDLPFPLRMWQGWKANLPVLLKAISIPVALGSVMAAGLVRRDRRILLILSVPLLHMVLGLAGKPNLHPAHHLPVVAYLFLAGSVGFFFVSRRITARRGWRTYLGTAGLIWALLHLAPMAHEELFFAKHNDTRRLVKNWAINSVPENVKWNAGRYTFSLSPVGEPLPVPLFVRAGKDPLWPAPLQPWFHLSLEDTRFNIFQNRAQFIYVRTNEWLNPPVTLPFLAPLPIQTEDSMTPLDFPWAGRTPLARDVDQRHPVRSVTVTTQSLDRVWIAVRTASSPAHLNVRFGNQSDTWVLKAGTFRIQEFQAPRPLFMPHNPRYFYRWNATARWGQARVILFTDGAQAGLWAMKQGDIATAQKLLVNEAQRHPLYEVALAAIHPSSDPARVERARQALSEALTSPEAWMHLFGASQAWFAHLPYLIWSNTEWVALEDDPTTWQSPPFHLEPGPYQFQANDAAGAVWTLVDTSGRAIASGTLPDDTLMNVPHPAETVHIRIAPLSTPPAECTLRPDAAESIRTLLNWTPLPDVVVPASTPLARFENGIMLVHAEVDTTHLHPGEIIPFRLDWELPAHIRRPGRSAVWVHLVNTNGDIVAQGDHSLWGSLGQLRPDPRNPPIREEVLLPIDLPAGPYELRVGLWIPSHRRRVKVKESTLPHQRRYVVLETIHVSEPSP